MAFPVKYAVPQQALLTILTVLAWQSHCLTDDGLFCNSNDLMSSGSVTNVTGTLSRMRNTFCWTVRMNILLASAHSTASWSSHAPQYEDSPTRLRTFINQPGIYGVASFLTECLVALFSGNFLVPFWLGFRLFQSFRSEAPQRHVWRCNLTSPYLNLQPL